MSLNTASQTSTPMLTSWIPLERETFLGPGVTRIWAHPLGILCLLTPKVSFDSSG